jgi:excinuclease UvrABC nuclease subunit
VALTKKDQLPNVAAIYFVLDAAKDVLYIGRSKSLCFRWQSHHHYARFESLPDIRIAWLTVSDMTLLPDIEKALIAHFQPPLNGPRYVQGRQRHKQLITLRLTEEATHLLQLLSAYHGISHTAVMEMAIREKARREQGQLDDERLDAAARPRRTAAATP